MSSPLQIVPAVTAALRDLLQDAVGHTGATVTNVRLHQIEKQDGAVVNLFLYQCTPNPSFRNDDVPTRNAQGEILRQPAAAVDLHYLVTFHGKEDDLQPQELLELSWARLHAEPILKPPKVAGTPSGEEIAIRITPAAATFEDMHRLWSVFPQASYSLGALFEAGPVFLTEPVLPIAPKPPEKLEIELSLLAGGKS